MHDVLQMLARARIISVIGPGGVGKSRFALRVAARCQRGMRDGAWLVELSSVSDPALVPEVLAGVLGVPERAGRDPAQALTTFLADRELLIVLDNCEHLRDASAVLLATMLTHCPKLRVLATSQEVLGLPGEAVYRLQPLATPDKDAYPELAELSPAVALFADRAAYALTGFKITAENVQDVVELCRRLDGMPLAIELAASHAGALSPGQILERIGDKLQLLAIHSMTVPARHQSLSAAVEWSYELCGKPERILWNRLSVFPGSFDLSAAEAVCAGDGLTTTDIVTGVAELVDRSVLLAQPGDREMRYKMLEALRDHGRNMLRESESEAREHYISMETLAARHLHWCVARAHEFDQAWFGPGQHQLLERVRADLPNFRAALAFAVDQPIYAEAGLRLAGDLCFFWRVIAVREGQGWLSRLLATDSTPSVGRARSLLALTWLIVALGQQGGDAVAADAVSLAERLDPERTPRAMALKGVLANRKDPDRGHDDLVAAVDHARRIGSTPDTAYNLHCVGWALGLDGAAEEAENHFGQAVAVCEAADELWWRGVVQCRRSLIAWTQADLGLMETAATEALRAARTVPDTLTCADAVSVLGVVQVGSDDKHAAYLLGAAERAWDDAGGSLVRTPPWASLLAGAKERCRTAIGAAPFDENHRRGREGGLQDAITAALRERTPAQNPEPGIQQFGLTQREREIVRLISEGLTNREISARLVISTRTAETHVQNILTKTGFTTRSKVAAWHAAHQTRL